LYNYRDVEAFGNFTNIPIDDDDDSKRFDFAFLTSELDDDEIEGLQRVHNDGCCYEQTATNYGL